MGERTRAAVGVVARADPARTPLHRRRPAVGIVTVDHRRKPGRLNAHHEPAFVERQNPSPSGRRCYDLPSRGLERRRVLTAIDAPRVRLAGEAEWVPFVSQRDLPLRCRGAREPRGGLDDSLPDERSPGAQPRVGLKLEGDAGAVRKSDLFAAVRAADRHDGAGSAAFVYLPLFATAQMLHAVGELALERGDEQHLEAAVPFGAF